MPIIGFYINPSLCGDGTSFAFMVEYCAGTYCNFAKLTLLSLLADTFSGNLGQGALATGKIKKYQLTLSILFLMIPLFHTSC